VSKRQGTAREESPRALAIQKSANQRPQNVTLCAIGPNEEKRSYTLGCAPHTSRPTQGPRPFSRNEKPIRQVKYSTLKHATWREQGDSSQFSKKFLVCDVMTCLAG
jgi:hypothetical protein